MVGPSRSVTSNRETLRLWLWALRLRSAFVHRCDMRQPCCHGARVDVLVGEGGRDLCQPAAGWMTMHAGVECGRALVDRGSRCAGDALRAPSGSVWIALLSAR